jgi:hypothetical protein
VVLPGATRRSSPLIPSDFVDVPVDALPSVDQPGATCARTHPIPFEGRSIRELTAARANRNELCEYIVPVVDEDLLLRFRGGWVALTDMQAPIVRLLLANLDRMVSVDEIGQAYVSQGGSTRSGALRSLMHRIAKRLIDVGVTVTFDRRRAGMMVSLP